MSNSPLVSYTKISPNKTSPRNHKIDTITIHCAVGQLTAEALGSIFAPTSRQASSNYGIGFDGKVGMYVEEKDRSWCSSSRDNDNRAITIECACNPTTPYEINNAVYSSLVELCADICKRNGIPKLIWKNDKTLIGQIDKQNMTVHRWFSNTECPGSDIMSKLEKIAYDVNTRLGITTTTVNSVAPLPILSQGCVGKSVRVLQILLNGFGFDCGKVDGSFGPATNKAVKNFQSKNGLEVDGSVGPKTWTKLLL